MTPELATRLRELILAGATVLVSDQPEHSPSLRGFPACDETVRKTGKEIWPLTGAKSREVGKGRVVRTPFDEESLETLGIERDFIANEESGAKAEGIAWTHRAAKDLDIYFISNQRDVRRTIGVSLRASGRAPELWDAVTGEIRGASLWRIEKGRTHLPLRMEPGGSIFVVLREATTSAERSEGKNWSEPRTIQKLDGSWFVSFDPKLGGPKEPLAFDQLESWTSRAEPGIRHYSGAAVYARTFSWDAPAQNHRRVWLDLGRVANIAAVTVNGIHCGVAWTAPWRVEITHALRRGENDLRIEVTNTWANRLIGDHALPGAERITWTNAPYRLEGMPLMDSGLLGPVTLSEE